MLNLSNTIIGKYELLELITTDGCTHDHSSVKYKVRCIRCGWEGVTSLKTIYKSEKDKHVKCSHIGGNVKSGDVFGKYTVIKRAPAKLSGTLLLPYFVCKCNRCHKIVVVSSSSLYSARKRTPYDTCRHKGV